MSGAFVQQRQGSNIGSSTSFTSGSITTALANSIAMIVTYTGANTSVTPAATFGVFVEDASLQHLAGGGVGMHVFTIDSCLAATGNIVVNFGAARTNRGIYFVEMSGIDHYIGGVFPAYQVAPGTGPDAISSGNFNVTGPPNYLLGFSWDQTGGGVAPSIGAGSAAAFTNRGQGWTFADTTSDARLMDARATSAGNVAATFETGTGGDTFAALLLAFAEQSSTQLLMSQCMY